MTVYSSTDVYPTSFDDTLDIDLQCDECGFECGVVGYCLKEVGGEFIINTLLEDKGYRQPNLDFILIHHEVVPCLKLYTKQCPVFINNMKSLGFDCKIVEVPRHDKKYLSYVVIENGVDPLSIAPWLMDLEVIL